MFDFVNLHSSRWDVGTAVPQRLQRGAVRCPRYSAQIAIGSSVAIQVFEVDPSYYVVIWNIEIPVCILL